MKTIPWAGLNYAEASTQFPLELEQHLASMEADKADAYVKYLQSIPPELSYRRDHIGRPLWVSQLYRGQIEPDIAEEFRRFLSGIPESIGRTYCGTLCSYDDFMGASKS